MGQRQVRGPEVYWMIHGMTERASKETKRARR